MTASRDNERTGSDLDAVALLRAANLRPTRQRRALVELLLGQGHRHVTAERLHEEARNAGVKVSLATVYNALHQFTRAGLLRELVVDAGRAYFDTNTEHHHHFFDEESGVLIDIPSESVAVGALPTPPDGREVSRVDVIVRVRDRG
jgi:Fur family iron response transcriptional regulator